MLIRIMLKRWDIFFCFQIKQTRFMQMREAMSDLKHYHWLWPSLVSSKLCMNQSQVTKQENDGAIGVSRKCFMEKTCRMTTVVICAGGNCIRSTVTTWWKLGVELSRGRRNKPSNTRTFLLWTTFCSVMKLVIWTGENLKDFIVMYM